ncbi:hypothetical protein SAMN05216276_104732 [Streptosporangium subroseum]|uniref:Uncharacterized protein n=1 Tax=Streptosporangium subroseum TaxID=106412 RepID=A0A239MYS8_9ACTN|nr:hypothetical protein [Streptosporangium subroseum]SNT47039.1 hypothetical protein SAMN05216276_104732 [Streptosporangium subroseum]
MKHKVEVRHDHRIAVRGLLASGLRALGNRIFGEIDAFAWVQGWEIDRSRWFRRVYRDPRFDTLQECGLCRGEGRIGAGVPADTGTGTGVAGAGAGIGEAAGGAGEMCGLCGGSGRIRRLKAGVRDEA